MSIAIDTHGYIYVTDQLNDRIQKFVATPELALAGAPKQRLKELAVTATCGSGPCAVGLSGKIVVRERRGKRRGSGAGAGSGGSPREVAAKRKKITIALGAGELDARCRCDGRCAASAGEARQALAEGEDAAQGPGAGEGDRGRWGGRMRRAWAPPYPATSVRKR